jgi:biotin operon repressor
MATLKISVKAIKKTAKELRKKGIWRIGKS